MEDGHAKVKRKIVVNHIKNESTVENKLEKYAHQMFEKNPILTVHAFRFIFLFQQLLSFSAPSQLLNVVTRSKFSNQAAPVTSILTIKKAGQSHITYLLEHVDYLNS